MDTQELMEEVGDLNIPFHAPARTSPGSMSWAAAEAQPPSVPQLCPTASQGSVGPLTRLQTGQQGSGEGGKHRPRQERPQPASHHSQGQR